MKLRNCIPALFVLALSGLVHIPLAVAKDKVDWVTFDYPPMYVTSGEMAGQGYMDNVLQMLIERLPDYEHSIRVANVSRIMSELEQGNEICIASLFVNEERKRLGWISEGNTTFLPPVQLVYRAEDKERFEKFGSPASFEEVIKDTSLTIGVADRMSYGKIIDKIVAEHKGQPNVFLRSGEDVGLGLHEMLMKKRIDYTVNYPWAATFTAGLADSDKLGFLPFHEAGKNPVHHVICTKTDLGKRVIEDVDKLLAEPELIERRREFITRWLPEDGKAEFIKAFNAHFGLK